MTRVGGISWTGQTSQAPPLIRPVGETIFHTPPPPPDPGYIRREEVEEMIRAVNQRPNLEETYQGPFPQHILQAHYPRGYKTITLSTFSGEDVESAMAHLIKFRVQCGQHQNDDILKCKIFATSLSGTAFTWYTRLQPGSITDWPVMEKLFRETFRTIEPEVDLASLTQMAQQPTESAVAYLQRFQI
ncbi:uncharacterized protein LOC133730992 [Rosa rugosa]|uniref:uncharacterized protein LOC133730992 n=1 Tax=Rosa rugosa TaxID=74645 RepID=UPI002B41006A|nr:uncharacterized protein LOC133730992 [Rosa rugosa]